MSRRPHVASLVEDGWNSLLGGVLRRRGWRHRIVAHVGYGGPGFVRVLARVVLTGATPEESLQPGRRGWRNFVTAEATGVEVRVRVGDERHTVRTDRSGNVDARLLVRDLDAGWQQVVLETDGAEPVTAAVHVVAADATFGLVSDIDDTVIRTFLPRPLVAAYNTFVLQEQTREPVRGMAELYAALLAEHPGAPVVYVSTGAWNTAATLRRFLARYGFPTGAMLLTDWGPTNTGWFRSGREHKQACLRRLAEDLPGVSWVLVGDDGQHDPAIYADFARERPDRVRAIAIRELGLGEQVLAHGTPGERVGAEDHGPPSGVPEHRAADGFGLGWLLGLQRPPV